MTSVALFWMEDVSILLSDPVFFPTKDMTKDEKLNALTRLALIVSVVLYFVKYPSWHIVLLISISAIIMLKYGCKTLTDPTIENFARTPTYLGNDFTQTIVPPIFAEEHHNPPMRYELFEEPPIPELPFTAPEPHNHPYGQYITAHNMLPGDPALYRVQGHRQAREYHNSAVMRSEVAARENATRLFKKKIARRYRHNMHDIISPYGKY